MLIPANSYATLRQQPWRWVDLRSPAEFARDHIPGALNVPLFDDEQRALVGTLYKKESPQSALGAGLNFVEQRIPLLLTELLGRQVDQEEWQDRFEDLSAAIEAGTNLLELESVEPSPSPTASPSLAIYCWRGGMRSRSVAALLQALGVPVMLLEGGYKGYRSWVMEKFTHLELPPLVVLRGPTGVGKTAILAELEKRQVNSTLCLESLAAHRSSVLGAVGKEPVSQPMFDSLLLLRLMELGADPIFIEGESRKVGDVILPDCLWQAMERGSQVQLRAETVTRVQNLMDDYLSSDNAVEAICAQLPFLEGRIGKKWVGELESWLREGRAAEVTEVLLERYYDPLYAHGDKSRSWCSSLKVESPSLMEELFTLRQQSAIHHSGEPPRLG
jgi:tRNA 2-selenouridine synthase